MFWIQFCDMYQLSNQHFPIISKISLQYTFICSLKVVALSLRICKSMLKIIFEKGTLFFIPVSNTMKNKLDK